MNKKSLIIAGIAILLILIIGISIFAALRPKPQVKSQAEIIQDQIAQIDTEYGQKIMEVVDKQKENNCIAEKEVEMTRTLTGEKFMEKQWRVVSTEGICADLQKQKDDLAKERSYKSGQLFVQLDALTARPEAEREKAIQEIRKFMDKPDLGLVYIATRHPSNFNVGRITNQDAGGLTIEDVSGWERKVEVYQQKDFINDQCEVYEYEVDPRNNQIVEIHVRYPDGVSIGSSECSKLGSMYYPLKTKDQIEKAAFDYLGRIPESTGSMLLSSSIQPQYIPSMKGAANPSQSEWRWEDKGYKLPDGLYSDTFPYPVLRIGMTSGGKLLWYFNTTGLFIPKDQLVSNNSTWEQIKTAIANCEVETTFQSHSLDVSAKLKNGTKLNAVEPKIDEIINLAVQAETNCGKIRMATE